MARPIGGKTKKPNARKTGPRFTLTERERLKVEVQKLDLQGYSDYQIAERLNVSRSTVRNLTIEINDDYKNAYVDDRKRWAMKCTAAHLDVIGLAQEKLAVLKEKGKVREHQEECSTDKGAFSKRATTKETAEIGGLLATIQRGWMEIAAIHGIKDLPAQVFVQANNNANLVQDMLDRMFAIASGAEDPPSAIEDGRGTVVVDATSPTEKTDAKVSAVGNSI